VTVEQPVDPRIEKDQLRAELAALGVVVDLRWGIKRLRVEAATARAAEAAE
jgi:hypothetical protein